MLFSHSNIIYFTFQTIVWKNLLWRIFVNIKMNDMFLLSLSLQKMVFFFSIWPFSKIFKFLLVLIKTCQKKSKNWYFADVNIFIKPQRCTISVLIKHLLEPVILKFSQTFCVHQHIYSLFYTKYTEKLWSQNENIIRLMTIIMKD